MSLLIATYKPRRLQDSDYYHCVEDYFETFAQVYEDQFSKQYEFWQPYLQQVIHRYLDCGELHNGFARAKLVLDLIGDAKTAATNTCWHSPVTGDTFTHPAIRSA